MHRLRIALAAFLLFPLLMAAQDLKEFEKRVTEFTLPNGMHFIVLERHDAPVVSFHTYVDAGSVDDPGGETGLAHMFEHMAFKGTETIGTKNWPAEKKALAEVERIQKELQAERNRGQRADREKIKKLGEEFEKAVNEADTYVVPNLYPQIIEENGGVGLNAQTGEDATQYYYSLPENRVELWFLLESSRFLHPVFREFYKERDVVREERRMRVESDPQGKLVEMALATAFAAHPYRKPTAGWASDIANLTVDDAQKFFRTYYVPNNITIAICGDVRPSQIKQLAQRYFGRIPGGVPPPPVHTMEPPQTGEKRVAVESPAQPFVLLAYKRPDQLDKDDPVFDVISGILASGRTGMLYRDLVRDKKIALAAVSESTFPGGEYPNLFVFFMVPTSGHTNQENEKACYEIIDRLKNQKVDSATLERVKTKVRAGLIRQLGSNSGLASQLTYYYVNYGDWRKLFTGLQDIDRVTADDVQRVARKYFVEDHRTVAYTVRPEKREPAEAAPAAPPAKPPVPTTPGQPRKPPSPTEPSPPGGGGGGAAPQGHAAAGPQREEGAGSQGQGGAR